MGSLASFEAMMDMQAVQSADTSSDIQFRRQLYALPSLKHSYI